ncbi:rubredoxin domain-containing protein [Algoriphagus zhangzhouensis]|uniref:Rubredoxin n=1 Tax=Algoriphagus zhangzhouensis TaxID=1073327 RepID=A0A1M7ZA95_9BACT|nr:rubredoxin domain-containing protein [Algoriphagus zhangzhouensis]TDY47209.1 rubredoxin [Algoriphagus zhangzhouensis]SHO61831.1 Rubredoxin [Algoriphagus zhangzhouensis]
MKQSFSRVTVKGGVLSPAELKQILILAENAGLTTISLGSRQDILFINEDQNFHFEPQDKFQIVPPGVLGYENIVSSYVSADILPNTPWLTGDRYLYILEQFRSQSSLKINITDPRQRLVPLYTGHLNFIASEHEDYWYLYVRLPEWEKTELYPAMIYSWDLEKVSSAIEKLLKEEPETTEMLFELVNDLVITNNRTVDKELEIPFYPFPYYEGINRVGEDTYWLGLYWRNNKYYIEFLKFLCDLCADCRIGKISITPWKSIIIKGIQGKYKLEWEKLLGRHGINVRHSMLELNWHLPVNNKSALELKQYLVSNFDKNDISTYGLTFSITDYTKKAYYFTSIVIEKNQAPAFFEDVEFRSTYNLLYAKDFDPNNQEYIVHVQEVDQAELPELLIELSKMYFDQLGKESNKSEKSLPVKESVTIKVYQCQDCLTIYDPSIGDQSQGISAETSFEELTNDYHCSLCESPKSHFEVKEFTKIVD